MSSSEEILLPIRKADILISFAIAFLTECESNKKWKKITGIFIRTCGYTAPGIGLLLRLFIDNDISSQLTLQSYLTRRSISKELFMDIVNETIGNLLDVIPECPVTQTQFGIMGLIRNKPDKDAAHYSWAGTPKVYKVITDGRNLVLGANVISFTNRGNYECDTFHHACIYILPPAVNTCYIIDSWTTPNPTDFDSHCRPLVSRPHSMNTVYSIIDELNSITITLERTIQILSEFFLAHNETIHQKIKTRGPVLVHTINPLYIQHIYNECERMILTRAQTDTNFGGKTRKRYKNRRTTRGNKNRQNKKYRTKKYKSNRKYKIYRGTLIKNKKT